MRAPFRIATVVSREKVRMIRLMKDTFYNEPDAKKQLARFIARAKKLSMDKEVARFEERFAGKQERAHAVFVNSGSTANLLLFQALLNAGALKKGDRVGVSALTWATNVMPIIQLGLVPVAIDCEVDTLNVSSRILRKHIRSLRALFITNVLGFADDIGAIRELCAARGVLLLEDNCESLGSLTEGRLLGNFGYAGTFSFFVGHHLSTIEGGMVVTDDADMARHLRLARAHGWDRDIGDESARALRTEHGVDDFYARYTFYELSYNIRPSEIHGFLGNHQLKYWDEIVKRRQMNYRAVESVIAVNEDLVLPRSAHMDVVSNFAIPIVAKDEKISREYRRRFEEGGVEIRPVIAGDITKQPFFRKYVRPGPACPNADLLHRQSFYIPNRPDLTSRELAIFKKLLAKI